MRQTNRQRRRQQAWIKAAIIFAALMMASCSLMKEDRSDCPDCRNPLRVKLRYDYNTMRANMFPDHVEEATVYVVDPETNAIIDFQTSKNTAESKPLREPSFGFNFEELPAGNYRLYASARSAADAAISVSELGIAESIRDLTYTLPTSTPAQRLDTVWNTLQAVDVYLPEKEPAEATIGLMRLTNDLNVMIFRRDDPLDNDHERYDVTVTDEHSQLAYDNESTASGSVTYSPFAAWTTETYVEDVISSIQHVIAERNAHYDFSLFRLINSKDTRHNPRLIIRNHETGHTIVNIDLCYYLALARNAYEIQNYSPQEFLDREYDYRLDFGIEGSGPEETWKYVTISINVLSWAIRIQNEEL